MNVLGRTWAWDHPVAVYWRLALDADERECTLDALSGLGMALRAIADADRYYSDPEFLHGMGVLTEALSGVGQCLGCEGDHGSHYEECPVVRAEAAELAKAYRADGYEAKVKRPNTEASS